MMLWYDDEPRQLSRHKQKSTRYAFVIDRMRNLLYIIVKII